MRRSWACRDASEAVGAFAEPQSVKTALDQRRFRPGQWMNVNWVTYPKPEAGERWFGFECVRELSGLPPEVLLVPPGTFAAWMRRRGRLGGQNKVPRVVNDTGMLEELRAFAEDAIRDRGSPSG